MTYGLSDLVGNIGVAMIIAAYFLLQRGRWGAHSRPYLLCNLVGAALVLLSLVFDFNLSAAVIQIFWIAVSVMGLLRLRPAAPGAGA